MTISINEIASGVGLMIDGQIYIVESYEHVKPGKGSAFARVRIRNIKTQQVLERTFRSAESLDDIDLEERRLQNLYKSVDSYHFMCHETFEEITVSPELLGDNARFLQENLEVKGLFYGDQLLKVELPTFIVAEIMQSDTGLKGDSTKAGTKPAIIDTGATIQVPLFVNAGDFVKIDTRTGAYVERVKK